MVAERTRSAIAQSECSEPISSPDSPAQRLHDPGAPYFGVGDLWKGQGHYKGAVAAVDAAITQDQIAEHARPPSRCAVMTIHQLKGREFDEVVIVEYEYNQIIGRDEAPYMQSRRLLQVAITRARERATIVTGPRGTSTLDALGRN